MDILKATDSLIPKPKPSVVSVPAQTEPTDPDKLTLSWLFKRMTVRWWVAIVGALAAALFTAFTIGGAFVAQTTLGQQIFQFRELDTPVQAEVAPEPVKDSIEP